MSISCETNHFTCLGQCSHLLQSQCCGIAAICTCDTGIQHVYPLKSQLPRLEQTSYYCWGKATEDGSSIWGPYNFVGNWVKLLVPGFAWSIFAYNSQLGSKQADSVSLSHTHTPFKRKNFHRLLTFRELSLCRLFKHLNVLREENGVVVI